MKEQMMVYEVKSSATENAIALFSDDKKAFYWNDKMFKAMKKGDYVYVVNTHDNWVLLTRFNHQRIQTKLDETELKATFNDEGQTFVVEAPTEKKLKEWNHFIKLSILKYFQTPGDWNWTSLGSAEISYFNGPKVKSTNKNRIKNINELKKLSNDTEHHTILEECMKNFENHITMPEILDALKKPFITELLKEKDFYFQRAVDTFQRFNEYKEPYEGFYEELKQNFAETDKKFIPFLDSYEDDSEQRQFLLLVGELISYCDRQAANKRKFNQYPDKRTLARAFVRQDDWVKNLIEYKIKGNQTDELIPSVRNAIHYLMDPESGLTMLSENHRKLLVENLLNEQYREDSFIDDVLTFFKPYKIQPENSSNYTYVISNILYSDSVKKLWDDKVIDGDIGTPRIDLTEKQLVHHSHQYLTFSGFRYQYDEIANFYLALRTKPFVILAGISGTGKTQLPRKLAEALGFSDKQIFLVPVRPDWTDGSDLLGYTSLSNQFIPKDLTQAIQAAQNKPDQPHFFILDEMNLARVEHYFSDFLSVIETRKRNNGRIETQPILRSETLREADNKDEFDSIIWPENLFLIGTVNMDETTFTFSRKVLDRANTIEMNDIDLNWIEPSGSIIDPLNNVNNGIFRSMYLSPLEFSDEDKESISGELKLLIEVNETLRAADLHFAYRVRDEIAYYLIMNQKFELMSPETAMDFQFVQKILPRIHGSSERVQNVLIELLNILEDLQISTRTYEYSNLEDKLKSHEFKYKRTADKILFMLKRFDEDRFTSFWL